MRVSSFGRYALTCCVAVAMLAGCGASQPPIGTPGAMPSNYKASVPLLYVTNYTDYNDVKVYDAAAKDPSPIEVISADLGGPWLLQRLHRRGWHALRGQRRGWSRVGYRVPLSQDEAIQDNHEGHKYASVLRNRWYRKPLGDKHWWTKRHGVRERIDKAACGDHEGIVLPGWNPQSINRGTCILRTIKTEGTKSFAPGNVVVYQYWWQIAKKNHHRRREFTGRHRGRR